VIFLKAARALGHTAATPLGGLDEKSFAVDRGVVRDGARVQQRLGRQDAAVAQSLAAIRAQSAAIDSQAAAGADAVNTAMPDTDPKPTEAERRQLGEWLACGAR